MWVKNVLGYFVCGCRISCMWVKNVLGYFARGCKLSWDILYAGVECPRIFCMRV